MNNRFLLVSLAVLFTVSAFGVTRLDDGSLTGSQYATGSVSDQDYLNLGSQFSGVGIVSLSNSNGAFRAGSGTLIGDQWVLTAAHVANEGSLTGANVELNGVSYTVDAKYVNPLFNGNVVDGHDVALLHLSTAVDSSITRYGISVSNVTLGTMGYGVGYGNTGTGDTGDTGGNAWHERAFTNNIDALNPLVHDQSSNPNATDPFAGYMSDFRSPTSATNTLDSAAFGYTVGVHSSSTPTWLEGAIGTGDSGGALFVKTGSTYNLVGVTSYAVEISGRSNTAVIGMYGDWSTWSDIAPDMAWITQQSGIQAAPEPTTLLAVGLGLCGLFIKRKN